MVQAGLFFLGGLALLLFGARALVFGAGRLGTRVGIPPTVVGLVIVGFGTSLPELVVSLTAAVEGSPALALSNAFGSNLANIGLLLGVTALIRPLTVNARVVTREIPMLILASAAACALAFDSWLDGAATDRLSRGDGIVLLLLFGVFLYYTLLYALRQRAEDRFLAEARAKAKADEAPGALRNDLLKIVLGIAGVVAGAHFVVEGAVTIASAVGVPERVIGLTLVSLGTSLPELATCLVAARAGEDDLVVGSIVGSNLFNLLLIVGCSMTVSPADLPAGTQVDLTVAAGFALVLLPLAVTDRARITRSEGGLVLVAYLLYLGWLALSQTV